MDIIIDDNSVIKTIHEYLLSRKLFFSADALLKESGVHSSADYQGEQLMNLREYAIEGKWDDAKEYLQILSEILDVASYKRILFLLFRQRFCELCFGPEEENVETALKDTVVELQSYFTEAEKEAMMNSIHVYFDTQVKRYSSNTRAMATRLECYHELAQIVGPIFSSNGLHQFTVSPSGDRLICALAKGLLYDQCVEYCHNREKQLGEEQLQMKESHKANIDEFLHSASLSNTSNLILKCLKSIKEDHTFQQPIKQAGLEVRIVNIPLRQSDLIPSPTTSPEKEPPQATVKAQEMETAPKVAEAWEGEPATHGPVIDDHRHHAMQNFNTQDHPPSTDPCVQVDGTEQTAVNLQKQSKNQMQSAADVRDSYADFMAEQTAVRQERDRVLKELQLKEEQANVIRKNLQTKKEPPTTTEQLPPVQRIFPLQYIPVEKTEEGSAIRAVAFHPYGQVYAVGSNARNLKICAMPKQPHNPNIQRQKYQAELGLGLDWTHLLTKRSHVHKGSIYALSWNSDGSMLTSCSNDKMIKLFDFDFETNHISEPTFELAYHEGVVRDVTFLKDFGSGCVLASCGSGDCKVFTYDCEVDTMLHKLTGHVDQVLALYSWNNGMLASSSQDKSLRIWDLKSARCVSVLGFGTSPPAVPTSVCVDASGRYLVAGRDDHVISVYDMVAGKTLKDFEAHNGEVRSVRFNPVSPNLLLSGSYDGTALVTNVDAIVQQDPIDLEAVSYRCHHHTDKIIQCRWHPGGQSFASTSADHTCVLWSQQLRT